MISHLRHLLRKSPPLLDLYFYLAAAQLPLGLIRLLAIFDTARLILLLDLAFIVFVPISALANGLDAKRLYRPMLSVLVVFGISTLVGLAADNPISRVFLDSFRPISFFICYFSLQFAPIDWANRQNLTPGAAKVFVVGAAATLGMAFVARRLGYSFYLSITEIFFLLPLATLVLSKNLAFGAANFVLLLIGGRRGALLSAMIAAIPLVLRVRQKVFFNRILPAFAVVAVIGSMESVQETVMSFGTVEKTLGAINYNIEKVGENGWLRVADRMFDDRIREVRAVVKEVDRSWLNTIFGMGAGYSYFVESEYFDVEVPWIRGVHFSPVGIYAYYGLAGLALVFAFLARVSKLAIHQYSYGNNPALLAHAYLCIGFIFNTLTAFAVFISPCFAISAGILANHQAVNNPPRS